MSDIIKFNKDSRVVTAYLKSVHTPDYTGNPEVLINPVIPKGLDTNYAIVEDGKVRAMTPAEKSAYELQLKAESDALILEGKGGVEETVRAILDLSVEKNVFTKSEFEQKFKGLSPLEIAEAQKASSL